MQLKKKRGLALAQALTQASALLAGTATPFMAPVVQAAEASDTAAQDHGWQIDTAALLYKENDGRVQAIEPVINMKKDYGDERVLNLKLVLDSLTGASPNGAAPAGKAQTFTGPSGGAEAGEDDGGGYKTQAGELPLNDEFKDTRTAISAGWQQPIGNDMRINVGGNLSKEYDFFSMGLNGAIAKDINNKNTTLSAGLNLEFDSISPVGGAPEPLTTMTAQQKNGDDSRSQYDLLLGVTQILGRHSLLQLNYGLSSSSGYHTDPYKMLTVVDSSGNLIPSATPGQYQYLFEKRPDTRLRHSLYAEWKYIFTEDVVDLSYRFTTDDWGIQSNTLDAKYHWVAGEKFYVEPHLRWYSQSEADFYKPYLTEGVDVSAGTLDPLLNAASADSRLGAFDAITYGVKFGYALGRDSEVSFRVEQYTQTANNVNAPATGDLAGQDLVPDLKAMWVQFGYSFRW